MEVRVLSRAPNSNSYNTFLMSFLELDAYGLRRQRAILRTLLNHRVWLLQSEVTVSRKTQHRRGNRSLTRPCYPA